MMELPEGWRLVPVELPKEMADVLNEMLTQCHTVEESYAELLAAAPTPAAKEDEPVGYLSQFGIDLLRKKAEFNPTVAIVAEDNGTHNIPVFLHPTDDDLRKAAEEVLDCYDTRYPFPIPAERMFALINNLRKALEKR